MKIISIYLTGPKTAQKTFVRVLPKKNNFIFVPGSVSVSKYRVFLVSIDAEINDKWTHA